MTVSPAATAVRREIVVAGHVEKAFAVFTEQFDRIKPRDHNTLAVPIAETVVEPRVGGHIYDRGEDGSECRWARILAFEPPHRLVFSWDINPQWSIETGPERCSEVEATFGPEGDGTGVVARVPASGPPRRRLAGDGRGDRCRRRLAARSPAVRRRRRAVIGAHS